MDEHDDRRDATPSPDLVSMVNFLLGTVAGGVIACIITISAARHPDVQSRLGLMPAAHAAAGPTQAAIAPERCPVVKVTERDAKMVGAADKLFEPRRFWFVAP